MAHPAFANHVPLWVHPALADRLINSPDTNPYVMSHQEYSQPNVFDPKSRTSYSRPSIEPQLPVSGSEPPPIGFGNDGNVPQLINNSGQLIWNGIDPVPTDTSGYAPNVYFAPSGQPTSITTQSSGGAGQPQVDTKTGTGTLLNNGRYSPNIPLYPQGSITGSIQGFGGGYYPQGLGYSGSPAAAPTTWNYQPDTPQGWIPRALPMGPNLGQGYDNTGGMYFGSNAYKPFGPQSGGQQDFSTADQIQQSATQSGKNV